MILKSSTVSLWVRNIQLATFSVILGIAGLGFTDISIVADPARFFTGYNGWVAASIVNNSFGGLLIAVVIKYADNIVKNFATSVSIILATGASTYAWNLRFSNAFLSGCGLVCLS